MIQWLASVPLYIPIGMTLLGFNLLAAYACSVRRLAYWVVGVQGAFLAAVSLLPVDSLTYLWTSTTALLFLIVNAVVLLRYTVRAHRAKVSTTP